MEKVSTYDLALVIGGFLVGAAFIIMIFNMLGGGRRGGRGHHRHRHYDRGDRRYYDGGYEDDEGSNWLPIILLLIILGIGGVAGAQKLGVFAAHQAESPIKNNSIEVNTPTQKSTDAPKQQPGERDVQYIPPEEPVVEALILDDGGEYYIRVCILTKKDNLNAHCHGLKAAGLRVSTLPTGKDIAVYVGPYKSRAQAERVNENKGLGGVVEAY